jgi:hypothetical protein
MTQKFEETSSVLYNIKGVLGQKRKVKADKTVRLYSKQFKEEHESLFLVFSLLPRQLGFGMEQHIKLFDIYRIILTRYASFKHWVVIKRLFNKLLCQFVDIAEANPSIMKRVWCRDEAHFYVNGTFNKQKKSNMGKRKSETARRWCIHSTKYRVIVLSLLLILRVQDCQRIM